MLRGIGLFFRQILRREGTFVRSNAQVVAEGHRQAIREEIGCADYQRGFGRGLSTSYAGYDSERRDEAIVGTVDGDPSRSDGPWPWVRWRRDALAAPVRAATSPAGRGTLREFPPCS
jgi:hypothetical protein